MNYLSAEEALARVRNGMRIFIGSGCAVPQKLVQALVGRRSELFDVEIVHILTFGAADYAKSELVENFRHNAFFVGPNVRSAVNEGTADYTPIFLSEIPALFRSGRMPLDVALVQVSPPDAHGFCSFGVSVDVVRSAVDSARYIVAEVNPNMPRTHGDSFVHVSRIHAFVESDLPVVEFPVKPPSDEAMKIGQFIADLIENGATLQTGIGEIPSAVIAALTDKKDLGMHTEMLTEAIVPLIKAGILNCSRKSYVPGKIVTSFCFGTRKLYDYIHDNPLFAFLPTEFTNDPFRIAQNRKMVSISSALEVDLTGQVCADSIGTQFYSGFGGQVDFIRGAARSEGGKPIIALLSSAKKGELSRIVSTLKPGAGVVTSRADVHYVVTEYGIASLHGKSVRERTLALINIAHPRFRDDLQREARERHLLGSTQVAVPPGLKSYPKQYETHHTFGDQQEIFFRPIQPTDEALLRELFYSHSEQTILQRYHKLVDRLSREQVQRMVTLDYQQEMALVGVVRDATSDRERMVCVGRYTRDKAATTAEFALTVHDEFQGHGIGSYLLQRLIEIARENGILSFHARIREDNRAMLKLVHAVVGRVEMDVYEDVYRVRFDLPRHQGA